MNGKLTLIIFFVFGICALKITAENDFFKVPLEVREKNRPQRLVDNSDDPDMRALKDIQDKFFNIVSNSSVGKEFKSFKQLLHLVDSKAGIEIGRLMFQGVMIAYGKDNSNQLLTEFIDDFQYRVSPELADALIDYKDFLKTVDLKMIPLTIQTLFRKDQLGNSLAQMPLGQLVDLVQPEASKYGIDIKGVINGILGKGDSTFPDLVKKALDNFDVISLLKNLPKPDNSINEETTQSDISSDIKQQRRELKNPTLMLFKPFIAKLLKENKIDLEPDAVIQVLTPFVGPFLQGFMPMGARKEGKQQNGFDFSQLMPMLALLGSGLGGSKTDSRKQSSTETEPAETNKLEEKSDKEDAAGKVKNLMSGLLQMSDNMKRGKIDDTDAGKGEDLLKLAMSLMGNMGGKDKKGDDQIANLLNLAAGALQMSNKNGKQSEDQSAKTMELLQSVMSLMGNAGAGDKKDNGNPLNGLLGLASAFMGNKKDDKAGDPMAGLLSLASTFLNNNNKDGKGGDPMAGLLGLASQFMGDQKDGRVDIVKVITSILGGPNGKDIRSMIKMAAALFGTGKNKRRPLKKEDEVPGSRKTKTEERMKRLSEYKESIKSDPRYKAAKQNVETILNELKEIDNQTVSESSEDDEEKNIKKVEEVEKEVNKSKEVEEKKDESKIQEDKSDKKISFSSSLEKFARKIQDDKNVHSSLHQMFLYGKVVIASKFRTKKDFEDFLTLYLTPYNPQIDVQAITAPFTLTEKQFEQFVDQINIEEFRKNKLISKSIGDVIKRLLDKKLNKDLAILISHQMSSVLTKFGVKDATLENFPDKMSFIIPILEKSEGLPDGIEKLLTPLQHSLKYMINWYKDTILKHSSTPTTELEEIFVESLYTEVILPLKHLWKIRQTSKSIKSCVPREVCEFVNNIDEKRVVETLVSQIGSIIYGGYLGEKEKDPQLFIQILRASLYKGDCKEMFPITCDKEAAPKKDEDEFKYEHIEL